MRKMKHAVNVVKKMMGNKNMRAMPMADKLKSTAMTSPTIRATMRENVKMVKPNRMNRNSGNPERAVLVRRKACMSG